VISQEQFDYRTCCPSRAKLVAFARGALPPLELASLADHLVQCANCDAMIHTVWEEDPLQAHLRGIRVEDRFAQEVECARMQAKALAMRPKERPRLRAGEVQTIPGFDIRRQIGKGFRGTVYLAVQHQPRRDVVLKVLAGASSVPDRQRIRFVWERTQAARLTGARIVAVSDVLEAGEHLVIVTPHVEGCDLATIVHDRRAAQRGETTQCALHSWARLEPRAYIAAALLMVDQLIDAVAKIHAAGDTYPELTSSNCLVDKEGAGWFTDFGLSRLIGDTANVWFSRPAAAKLEAADQFVGPDIGVGAPGFISPEEWAGRIAGQPADVFRLGVIIYQALTLELPYGIGSISLKRRPPAAPSSRQPLVVGELDAVVLKALQVDHELRYRSASELNEEWRKARSASKVWSAG
jgi:serine/threonine protein kinase